MVTTMLGRKRSSFKRVRKGFFIEHLFIIFDLSRFYQNNQFDVSSNRFNNEQIESTTRSERRLAFLVWSLFILFWSYCLVAFIKIKFYFLLVCLFHVIMDVFANGIIDFVCQLDANYRASLLRRSTPAIKED